MFVTFLLATLEITTGKLVYVRAGHIPPFHRNGTGKASRGSAAWAGRPLGLVEDAVYQPDMVVLAPGDRLLVVTDGFTEAHDPDNVIYGEGKIEVIPGGARALGNSTAQATGRPVCAPSKPAGRPSTTWRRSCCRLARTSQCACDCGLRCSTLATPEAIRLLIDRVMAFLERARRRARATHHTALVLTRC